MTKDTILLLAKYNEFANTEMNKCIEDISPEQWQKEFGGYFKSIKAVCTHVYIADFNWLKRFGGIKSFSYLGKPFFKETFAWDADIFSDIPDYLKKRRELDECISALAAEIRDEELSSALDYATSKGEPQSRNAGGLLLHMFNHETHHRGMISLYLDMLGVANDFSNLMTLV
jgi:uncharacterized damage-inducible protein DinB